MKTVEFGLATLYDNGLSPGVGLTPAGLAVEVHQSENFSDLYYHVGTLTNGQIFWSRSAKYDDGIDPDIAINKSDKVVEVHASGGIVQKLWYHVGDASGTGIDFGKSHEYDSGVQPAVSLNDSDLVVEVHEAQGGSNLWFNIGRITGDTITWTDHGKYATGATPSVAINNLGQVVTVFAGGLGLYYRTGGVDSNGKIQWAGPPRKVSDGECPSVALSDKGQALIVYVLNGKLISQVGQLASGSINWQNASPPFDEGVQPTVALSGDVALQAHFSGGKALWYSTSLLVDRKNWMKNATGLADRPLWKTVLPGTHDSGSFNLSLDRCPGACRDAPGWIPASVIRSYATAQGRDMQSQLEGGVRFFDWRTIYYDSDFHTYHDCVGPLMSEQIDQLAGFLKETAGELVIVKISHFCGFADGQHAALIERLHDKLGPYLYTGDADALLTSSIGSLTENGSRVVVYYDSSFLDSHPQKGFYKEIAIYDEYSNTDDFKKMWSDQQEKLSKHQGSPSRLFLLSFTLTFQDWKTVLKGGSLHTISEKANRNLGEFVDAYCTQYQTNILYVDFFEDARATDMALWLNRA